MRIHLAILLAISACTDDAQQPTGQLEGPRQDFGAACTPDCLDPALTLQLLDESDRFVLRPSTDGLLHYVTVGHAQIEDVDGTLVIPEGECQVTRRILADGSELFVGGCR